MRDASAATYVLSWTTTETHRAAVTAETLAELAGDATPDTLAGLSDAGLRALGSMLPDALANIEEDTTWTGTTRDDIEVIQLCRWADTDGAPCTAPRADDGPFCAEHDPAARGEVIVWSDDYPRQRFVGPAREVSIAVERGTAAGCLHDLTVQIRDDGTVVLLIDRPTGTTVHEIGPDAAGTTAA
jgi:hypothetical protein